jgi:glucose/arabinose dehydrogenase
MSTAKLAELVWITVRDSEEAICVAGRDSAMNTSPGGSMTSVNLPKLPAPYATPSAINFATVVGWPDGLTPKAPEGFTVARWAGGLDYPRWFHVLTNGDVLVAEARSVLMPNHDRRAPEIEGAIRSRSLGESANRITLLRDEDRDGIAKFRTIFLTGLDRPFGMALLGDSLYVANTDGVLVFPYRSGQTKIERPGKKTPRSSGRWLQQPLDPQHRSRPRRQEALRHRRLGQQCW